MGNTRLYKKAVISRQYKINLGIQYLIPGATVAPGAAVMTGFAFCETLQGSGSNCIPSPVAMVGELKTNFGMFSVENHRDAVYNHLKHILFNPVVDLSPNYHTNHITGYFSRLAQVKEEKTHFPNLHFVSEK